MLLSRRTDRKIDHAYRPRVNSKDGLLNQKEGAPGHSNLSLRIVYISYTERFSDIQNPHKSYKIFASLVSLVFYRIL